MKPTTARAVKPEPAKLFCTIAVGSDEDGYTEIPISQSDATELQKLGVLYPCGHEHDLHLTPDHKFSVADVERLTVAIHNAAGKVPPQRRDGTAMWTYERADEDDYAGFYIKRDGKTVADTHDEGWAQAIVDALNRDDAAHAGLPSSEPEIAF